MRSTECTSSYSLSPMWSCRVADVTDMVCGRYGTVQTLGLLATPSTEL